MDARERVFLALSHQQPDRVPIDYWGTAEVNKKLRQRYGLADQEQLLQHFDIDFRYIDGPQYIGKPVVRPDGAVEDHYGVPRRNVAYGNGANAGTYQEVTEYPLEKLTTVEEILNYAKWPQADWFDYECVREQARAARATGKVVVFMGDRLNRCAVLKPAMYVRGVEQILMDLYVNKDIARAVFQKIADFYVEYVRRTLEAGEGNIDILFTGDDFGMQENTFMPVALWRELIRDDFKRFIDLGHSFDCKVAHHTCGSIVTLIPDFIECGLDILNPLQPDVAGMDYVEIKKRYGHDISFHGAISIQKTMPYGSPQDVRNEVKDRIEKLSANGGLILCTAHNIQADTSLENVEALFKAYKEFGRYH